MTMEEEYECPDCGHVVWILGPVTDKVYCMDHEKKVEMVVRDE